MIAFVKGVIAYKSPEKVIIETHGVGYELYITTRTYAALEKLEQAKVLTYLHVKEDGHTLYGFADGAEKHLFILLIGVSGVGPSTAQQLLSSLGTEEIRQAIVGENESLLKGAKGIGSKTAKRIILDLKDKLLKESGADFQTAPSANNTIREEALMGLESLGIHKARARKAIQQVLQEQPGLTESGDLIKAALKLLS